jgi:hypothetical protein
MSALAPAKEKSHDWRRHVLERARKYRAVMESAAPSAPVFE